MRNPSIWKKPSEKARRTIGSTLLLYFGIAGLVAAAENAASYRGWALFLVLPLVAALQNHLQILQHDAAHGHLFRNRKLNDSWADLFLAMPFLSRIRSYRAFHFEHHRHVLDPVRDPELPYYADQGFDFKGLTRKQWTRQLI